jgi:hypothetical protein
MPDARRSAAAVTVAHCPNHLSYVSDKGYPLSRGSGRGASALLIIGHQLLRSQGARAARALGHRPHANLNVHLAPELADFAAENKDWLRIYRLPAYAPELNPAEMSLPQCELRRSLPSWLPGSLSCGVPIGMPSSVQRRRLW